MKNLFFLLLYLLATKYDIFAEDTIFVKPDQLLVNTSTKYNSIDDMELLNDNIYFYGYLVIRIDSNSVEGNTFNTSIFWIENIENIEIDSLKHFYNLIIGLISDGDRKYYSDKQNNLSIFIHFYNLFNYNNIPNKISYLYPFSNQFLTTNLLFDTVIWENNNNKKKYIIFETGFHTAVLYFKSLNKKMLIPTSSLITFNPVNHKHALNSGFTVSNIIISKKK